MNQQSEHQAIPHNTSHAALRQRFGFIALTLGCLLLVNTLFFAHIAHATATPTPILSTPEATEIPTPPVAPTVVPPPPPHRYFFVWPNHLGLTTLAFGSLLLIGTVFIARLPVVKARRRDEHDE
ncbi:MAG: hypothetical protein U0350_28715 [Caldilineaceae bacterium]